MFGRRFFGRRFFGPRYWGDGGVSSALYPGRSVKVRALVRSVVA